MNAKKFFRSPAFWALLLITVFALMFLTQNEEEYDRVDTSAAEKLITDGKVEDAHFTTDNVLQLDLKDGETYSNGEEVSDSEQVETEFIDARSSHMLDIVEKNVDGVQNDTVERPSMWSNVLLSILPLILLVALCWFILSRAQGGGSQVMKFGKSKAKLFNKEAPKVTFADVAGAEEAVEALERLAAVVDAIYTADLLREMYPDLEVRYLNCGEVYTYTDSEQ